MTSQSVFLRFSLCSTALWDLAISRPVHSLMLSSHLFFCQPCLLPPFIIPFKMVLGRPDERKTCPYHFSLHLFTMVRVCSSGPIAFWILAQFSSLVTRSLYEMRSVIVADPYFRGSYSSLQHFMRVHDSQAFRKKDVTRECISRILKPRNASVVSNWFQTCRYCRGPCCPGEHLQPRTKALQ